MDIQVIAIQEDPDFSKVAVEVTPDTYDITVSVV